MVTGNKRIKCEDSGLSNGASESRRHEEIIKTRGSARVGGNLLDAMSKVDSVDEVVLVNQVVDASRIVAKRGVEVSTKND